MKTSPIKQPASGPDPDIETVFLADAVRLFTFWKGEARKIREAGQDPALAEEYAQAFKLLLNRFSYFEEPAQEEQQ